MNRSPRCPECKQLTDKVVHTIKERHAIREQLEVAHTIKQPSETLQAINASLSEAQTSEWKAESALREHLAKHRPG